MVLDSRRMQVRMPRNKVDDLRKQITSLLAMSPPTVRDVARVLGKMNSVAPAIFQGRLHTRAVLADKIAALKAPQGHSESECSLSPSARADLQLWLDSLEAWNGKSIIPRSPDTVLTTDASDLRWSALLGTGPQTLVTNGVWTFAERCLSINQRELLAIEFGLLSFRQQLRDRKAQVILIRSDNTTAIAYLNHMGGTRSRECSLIAERMWVWALANDVILQAEYISTDENPADAPSREEISRHEWMLNPFLFQQLEAWCGPHHVDLFASRPNAQLQRYFSWKPDPTAEAVDALLQPWAGGGGIVGFANPPWILIPRILQKVAREQATITLIAPLWPTQAWYPMLLSMLIDAPVLLPQQGNQPVFLPPLVSQSDQMASSSAATPDPQWRVAAWRVSGDRTRQQAFQTTLPISPWHGLPSEPTPTMTALGPSGSAGAGNSRLIPLQDLPVQW